MMTSHQGRSPSKKHPLVKALHTVIKGRARYKVAGLRSSKSLQQYLELRLAAEDSISHVAANPNSGNILVFFLSDCSWRAIALTIECIVLDYRKQPKNCSTAIESTNSQVANAKTRLASIKRESKLAIYMSASTQEQKTKLWHLLKTETIVAEFETSASSGLSSQAVSLKLQKYGLNVLPENAPRSRLGIFIDQFKSVPVLLLSIAAGLSLATGGLVDAIVIMGVVVINAAIGYATESQSEGIINSLKHLVKPSALVFREGKLAEISAEEIVLGDLLVLKPGSYVAADARIVESSHLSVDESALTGESMPTSKNPEPLTQPDVPLGDRVNMVYMGTLVTGGQGLAVVVATGTYTEMGRIQSLVGTAILPETPMQRQLDRAGTQLVLLSSAVCGAIFGIGLLRGYGLLEMLKTSISLAVAAVPEGLPAVATTTLALGIQEMRKQKVLIRRLDAVEALGSIQSLCLDKTGTLTANKMTVVEISAYSKRIQVEEGQLINGREVINPYAYEPLLKLIHVVVLCNESQINGKADEYMLRGSATENALIELAIAQGVDVKEVREQHQLLKIHHRSEGQNYMKTLHHSLQEKKLVAVKGSPNEVLDLCNWQIEDNKVIALTEEKRAAIEAENERMAGKALRVLGVAYGHTDNPEDTNGQENLVWLGLVGMADPIRKGVKEVVKVFHGAGIDTIMITGDQSPTAYAIGKELNLSQNQHLEILDSTNLSNLDPEVMKGLCAHVRVFARISPAHKLQVVQALQQAGKVVAMTGDGINDAPALKAAEVGIAMGNTGTDVAREVADVVLEDDDLETMAIAIARGRTIYNNIRKSVHFLLSTNLSEILVMLSANTLGIGQPLNAMQLLWLNLVTDIFPGLALALEPAEPDVLSQPPRDPNEAIVPKSEFKRITFEAATLSVSSLGAYSYGIMRYGISPQASTIAFMSLTLGQLLHAISCRSRSHSMFSQEKLPANQYLVYALGGSFGLQLLSAAVPGLRYLLKLAPINLVDGVVVASTALLPLLVNEGTKVRNREQRIGNNDTLYSDYTLLARSPRKETYGNGSLSKEVSSSSEPPQHGDIDSPRMCLENKKDEVEQGDKIDKLNKVSDEKKGVKRKKGKKKDKQHKKPYKSKHNNSRKTKGR
jgi:Ca2+-transporting ATPase